MKKIILLSSVLACTLFANPYAKCIACHGPDGSKTTMGNKNISQMSKADFIAALKGYKDGSYGGAKKVLMVNQVKGLSDADMEAIAAKIAK